MRLVKCQSELFSGLRPTWHKAATQKSRNAACIESPRREGELPRPTNCQRTITYSHGSNPHSTALLPHCPPSVAGSEGRQEEGSRTRFHSATRNSATRQEVFNVAQMGIPDPCRRIGHV